MTALRVVQHLVHGHGHRVPVAQLDHPEAVADEDDVDARLVHALRLRERIGGDHRDLLPVLLHRVKVRDHDLLDVAHVDVLLGK